MRKTPVTVMQRGQRGSAICSSFAQGLLAQSGSSQAPKRPYKSVIPFRPKGRVGDVAGGLRVAKPGVHREVKVVDLVERIISDQATIYCWSPFCGNPSRSLHDLTDAAGCFQKKVPSIPI
jgi:hypothetical protein